MHPALERQLLLGHAPSFADFPDPIAKSIADVCGQLFSSTHQETLKQVQEGL